MMWGCDNYGWGTGSMMGLFGGGLMMIVFWVLLAIFIIWLIREISGRGSASRTSSRALEILKERYAKGEIDKNEFEQKKKEIGE